MKLNIGKIHTKASADFESADFDIGNKAVIMEILRGKMYSNATKAICQEIMCNARDAHREVGKPRVPIRVTFPTELEPTYTIRDFGPGITPQRIKEIYVMYGNSTKRGTNAQTGGFGLGSKTPFAYDDTFTVISITPDDEGQLIKREYVAYIDDSRLGLISLVNEGPTDEPQGTSIIVTIKNEDFDEFRSWTLFTAEYWVTKPKITNEKIKWRRHKSLYRGKGWKILKIKESYYYQQEKYKPYAIVDEIQYKIDIKNIFKDKEEVENLKNLSLRLFLKTGVIDLAANREQIDYSKKSIRKLKALIEAVQAEANDMVSHNIEEAPNMREAIIRWNKIPGTISKLIKPTWQGIKLVREPLNFKNLRSHMKISHYTGFTRTTVTKEWAWVPADGIEWVENDIGKGVVASRLTQLLQTRLRGVVVFTFLSNGTTQPAKDYALKNHWDKMGVILLSSLPIPKKDKPEISKIKRLTEEFSYSKGHRLEWVKADNALMTTSRGYYVLIKNKQAIMDDPKDPKILYDMIKARDLKNYFLLKKQELYGIFPRFEKHLGPGWKRITIDTIHKKIAAYKRTRAVRLILKYGDRAGYSWLSNVVSRLNRDSIAYRMAEHIKSVSHRTRLFTRMRELCRFVGVESPEPPKIGVVEQFIEAYPLLDIGDIRSSSFDTRNTQRSTCVDELIQYIKTKDAERKNNEVSESHPNAELPGPDVRPGPTCNGNGQEDSA